MDQPKPPPPVRPGSCLGIDGESSKLTVCYQKNGQVVARDYRPRRYEGGFEQFFRELIDKLEFTPQLVGVALAARPIAVGESTVNLTTLDWPAVNFAALGHQMGTRFKPIKQLEATFTGLASAGTTGLPLIVAAQTPVGGRKRLVLTVGTDIKDYTGAAADCNQKAWLPATKLERAYHDYGLGERGGNVFALQGAIGQAGGWYRMLQFCRHRNIKCYLEPDVEKAITEAHINGNIALAIQQLAVQGNEYCRQIVELYLGILATHIRNRAIDTSAPDVFLVGSLVSNLAPILTTVDDPLQNVFAKRLRPEGMDHSNIVRQITVRLIPDRTLGARGAYQLATKTLAGH